MAQQRSAEGGGATTYVPQEGAPGLGVPPPPPPKQPAEHPHDSAEAQTMAQSHYMYMMPGHPGMMAPPPPPPATIPHHTVMPCHPHPDMYHMHAAMGPPVMHHMVPTADMYVPHMAMYMTGSGGAAWAVPTHLGHNPYGMPPWQQQPPPPRPPHAPHYPADTSAGGHGAPAPTGHGGSAGQTFPSKPHCTVEEHIEDTAGIAQHLSAARRVTILTQRRNDHAVGSRSCLFPPAV